MKETGRGTKLLPISEDNAGLQRRDILSWGWEGTETFHFCKAAHSHSQNQNPCSSPGMTLTSPGRWGVKERKKWSSLGMYLLWPPAPTPKLQGPRQEGAPWTCNSFVWSAHLRSENPAIAHCSQHGVSYQSEGKFSIGVHACEFGTESCQKPCEVSV